jgi:hypothetical protein
MDKEFAEVLIRALMMIVKYLRKRYDIGNENEVIPPLP